MQLRFAKLSVSNQDKALKFYVKKLGFIEKADIMMGPHRFLTIAAPDGIDGVQLILESTDFPPSAVYQQACHSAGIPVLAINTDDIQSDYSRLAKQGIAFKGAPRDIGPIISVIFDDTCGNLIHLVQAKQRPG